MKTCRTVSGLLKARKNGEQACLYYTAIFRDSRQGVYEIYLKNGKKEVVSEVIYPRIQSYLREC